MSGCRSAVEFEKMHKKRIRETGGCVLLLFGRLLLVQGLAFFQGFMLLYKLVVEL